MAKKPTVSPPRKGRTVKVKTARGRKSSSTRWLQRQLNDPYVQAANREGYRSRAAYKLKELDDTYTLLKPGMDIVDLGCAPGSWCQVALERTKGRGHIIGLDLQEVETISNVALLQGDFTENETLSALEEMLGGKKLDVVLSDMAAASCGHPQTDHLRIMALLELAADFAFDHLKPGGTLLCKVLQGGAEASLQKQLKSRFDKVRHVKPEASRKDSAEMYVLATGFRG